MSFSTENEQEGWDECFKSVLQHLLTQHPEIQGTFDNWVATQQEKLSGLDFSEFQSYVYQMPSENNRPNLIQRGRMSALSTMRCITTGI